MSLAAGTTVGHYRVTSPLGRGGMGEVYRAHDSRLRRDEALTIAPWRRPPSAPPVMRLAVELGADARLTTVLGPALALSPDRSNRRRSP